MAVDKKLLTTDWGKKRYEHGCVNNFICAIQIYFVSQCGDIYKKNKMIEMKSESRLGPSSDFIHVQGKLKHAATAEVWKLGK